MCHDRSARQSRKFSLNHQNQVRTGSFFDVLSKRFRDERCRDGHPPTASDRPRRTMSSSTSKPLKLVFKFPLERRGLTTSFHGRWNRGSRPAVWSSDDTVSPSLPFPLPHRSYFQRGHLATRNISPTAPCIPYPASSPRHACARSHGRHHIRHQCAEIATPLWRRVDGTPNNKHRNKYSLAASVIQKAHSSAVITTRGDVSHPVLTLAPCPPASQG